MTSALFLLRCCQVGVSVADLELLTIGMVNDMFTELANDDTDYEQEAGQGDFNSF